MAPLLVMLAVIFAAVVLLSAVALGAWTILRRSSAPDGPAMRTLPAPTEPAGTRRARSGPAEDVPVPEPAFIDRVVRVMTLLFLASVGVVVFVTRAYPDTEVAIQVLIAGAMLAVVFLQDLLPAGVLGRARHWLEAIVATVFVAVLTGFTGGFTSPFYVGFFLVVAGASLSGDQAAPVLVALFAAGVYALVGVVAALPDSLTAASLVWLAFNVISLILLAYIASTVGREQRRAREAAISLSQFDPLTGIYNRSYFFDVLDREIRRAARTGSRFAVLMLDLDDLKPVNDMLGHPQGDDLLRSVTEVIRRDIRSTDVAARYGGDEFVVILSDTEPEGARVVAEKLRADIANLAVGPSDRPARTSASIGLVSYPDDGTTAEGLIADADKAMYESKRRGKNQIVGYTTRTERVTTPLDRGRTTMMERQSREISPSEASRREAQSRGGSYGSSPSGPANEPPARGRANEISARRPANEPPPRQEHTAGSRPAQYGSVSAWDSTSPPAAGLAADRARQAEPRPYVAFPVQRDDQARGVERRDASQGSPGARAQDARDFTDR
jgi:diguanylate cyclase (GGDEF)-like protein